MTPEQLEIFFADAAKQISKAVEDLSAHLDALFKRYKDLSAHLDALFKRYSATYRSTVVVRGRLLDEFRLPDREPTRFTRTELRSPRPQAREHRPRTRRPHARGQGCR